MQKKLIALAVAAVASGAAFAQTNVVISGNINYQLENIQGSTPTMAGVAGAVQQVTREGRARVNDNASNLKFTATEDLGNGLKAGVVIESGIQATDTSVSSATASGIGGGSFSRGGIGGRDTYVLIGGKFGEIQAGRISYHYTSQGKVDSFAANTALAANSLAILHGNGGSGWGTAAGARVPNAVQYITPSVSGFNATFGYARPNAVGDAANSVTLQGTTMRKESMWTVKGNFDNGPVTAFASYLAHNDLPTAYTVATGAGGVFWQNSANTALNTMLSGVVAGTSTVFSREIRGFRMGAAYTLPMGLKIGMIYDNTKTLWRDDSGNALTGDDDLNIKRTAWVIPVSWAFGSHTIGATYGKANNIQIGGNIATNASGVVGNVETNGTGARYWMMGYQYAFSKRTNVGVTYARIDNDSRAGYDFFSNAAMGQVTTGTTVNTRGSDPTSVSIGLKHSF